MRVAVLLAAAVATAGCTETAFEPLLFMDLADTTDPWGLIEPVASTVARNTAFRPPPGDYAGGRCQAQCAQLAMPCSHRALAHRLGGNRTGRCCPRKRLTALSLDPPPARPPSTSVRPTLPLLPRTPHHP